VFEDRRSLGTSNTRRGKRDMDGESGKRKQRVSIPYSLMEGEKSQRGPGSKAKSAASKGDKGEALSQTTTPKKNAATLEKDQRRVYRDSKGGQKVQS